MNTIVKCDTCLYNKNCQFIATHKNTVVEGCTSYKDTTDIIGVIRCKECKYFITDTFKRTMCNRTFTMFEMNENDFCSYGEREVSIAETNKVNQDILAGKGLSKL